PPLFRSPRAPESTLMCLTQAPEAGDGLIRGPRNRNRCNRPASLAEDDIPCIKRRGLELDGERRNVVSSHCEKAHSSLEWRRRIAPSVARVGHATPIVAKSIHPEPEDRFVSRGDRSDSHMHGHGNGGPRPGAPAIDLARGNRTLCPVRQRDFFRDDPADCLRCENGWSAVVILAPAEHLAVRVDAARR